MKKKTNILILSCGTRNKIVQYFKRELQGNGKVFATDCSNLAPALYDADEYFIVPSMTDEGYLQYILDICKEHKINAVLTLIDPEIELLAANKEKFIEIGTVPIVSELKTVKFAFDKYLTYEFLRENGFNIIKSYRDKELFYEDLNKGIIKFPVFVKPSKGSASINVNKVNSIEEIEILFKYNEDLIIQEFMQGQEFGADCYIDSISNKVVSIFVKEKLKMRAGETDKSVSFKDENLFNLLKQFIDLIGFKGVIDIDIFKVDGKYYISEVNPRFGGGYPHAYECGVNIPKMILTNLLGVNNEVEIGNYKSDVYMMKYNELKITTIAE